MPGMSGEVDSEEGRVERQLKKTPHFLSGSSNFVSTLHHSAGVEGGGVDTDHSVDELVTGSFVSARPPRPVGLGEGTPTEDPYDLVPLMKGVGVGVNL